MKFLSVVALVVATVSIRAQSVVSALGPTQSQGANYSNKTVTVNLKGVTLENALKEIAARAGMQIGFADEVISYRNPVSIKVENVLLIEAFSILLKPTGFVAVEIPGKNRFVVKSDMGGKSKSIGQGVITGKVTDARTGKAISGARVSVENDARNSTTGSDGTYRLTEIGAGIHTLSVRFVGYTKQTKSITIGEGATVILDFKLELSANVLEQVVVTGTIAATELKAVPNAVTVITAKQIEERGITRIDQLFRGDIPGLFALNRGSGALLDEVLMFSRGATALSPVSAGTDRGTNPIKTYIDGVEMTDSKYLSQIDPLSIERIEILTGPQASTIYGSNAINGVMQIFTKKGSVAGPKAVLSLETGAAQNNFNNHLAPAYLTDARISGVENRLSYNVGGSWNYLGAWTPAKQTQRASINGGVRMEMGRVTTDFNARYGVTRNKQKGSQFQGQDNLEVKGDFTRNVNTGNPTPQIQSLLSRTSGITLVYRPLSVWSHELVLGSDAYVTQTLRTAPGYSTVGRTKSIADTLLSIAEMSSSRLSQLYRTTIEVPVSSLGRLNLTLGGDHWRTRQNRYEANSLSLTGNLANPFVERSIPGKNLGSFIQGQLGFWDVMFLTYGLRADWNPTLGENVKVRPGRYGIAVTHEIGPVSAKLRGSYGRSIRPPAADLKSSQTVSPALVEFFGPVDARLANSNLGPEFQQGGEGGVEFYYGSRWSVVVTRYNQTVDNLISEVFNLDSVPSLELLSTPLPQWPSGYSYNFQSQNLNVGSIRNQGWELQGTLNSGPVATRGTYSWTKSRVIGVTPRYKALLTDRGFTPGIPFEYLPEHTWAISTTYSSLNTTVSVAINGAGQLYRTGSFTDNVGLATSSSNRLFTTRDRIDLPNFYIAIISGYATIDLNAMRRIGPRADALFQITNLADSYHNDFDIRYASLGRQVQAGIRVRR